MISAKEIEIKARRQFDKDIVFSKSVQDSWQVSYTLPDGYSITVTAASDEKARIAKPHIKEALWTRVVEVSEERGCSILDPKNLT